MLRAYDKNTGNQVGAILMPAAQSGAPMTYAVDGTQYVAVASGSNVFAFSLCPFPRRSPRQAFVPPVWVKCINSRSD